MIISPRGVKTTLSFNLAFECTNNQTEYEALVISLEILLELGAKDVWVIEDSQLVLWKFTGECKCNNLLLAPYFTTAIQLLDSFDNVNFNMCLGNLSRPYPCLCRPQKAVFFFILLCYCFFNLELMLTKINKKTKQKK